MYYKDLWHCGGNLQRGGSVAKLCPTLAAAWTLACQAPLFLGFSGKNAGMDCHFLLQGIFPTQESNLGLLHCRQTLYRLSRQGSPMAKFYLIVCLHGI